MERCSYNDQPIVVLDLVNYDSSMALIKHFKRAAVKQGWDRVTLEAFCLEIENLGFEETYKAINEHCIERRF